MIKTILFDLDDTIFDFHAAERAAIRKTLIRFGYNPDGRVLSRYSELNKQQWERFERGEITRGEVKIERFRRLLAEIGLNLPPEDVAAFYERRLSEGHIFIPGAEDLIKRLAESYRLFLVSNGTARVQNSRIASSGIAPYFDGIFISEEIGSHKPDPEFFRRCFSRIPDFRKSETVIVGDSLTSDIKGGKNAGIVTIWFNPAGEMPGETVPDRIISDLAELPSVLEKL